MNLQPTPPANRVSLVLQKIRHFMLLQTIRIHLAMRRLTLRRLMLVATAGLVSTAAVYIVAFYWPRTVAFTYQQAATCMANPVLLPELVSSKPSASFTVTHTPTLEINGYALYSHRTCVTPRAAPTADKPEKLSLSVGGLGFVHKNIMVVPAEPPKLVAQPAETQLVATTGSLRFTIAASDKVFNYRLLAGDKITSCTHRQAVVQCDLRPLQLGQSSDYTFVLARYFDERQVAMLYTKQLRTVEAITVSASSIAPGQTVYDAPPSLTLQLNKAVTTVKNARLEVVTDAGRQAVAATFEPIGNTVVVTWKEPIPRAAALAVSIDGMTATDESFLPAPYGLTFHTSGGPKVLGISIGAYKVSTSGAISLSLDSQLATGQVLGNFVKLEVQGTTVAAQVTGRGKSLVITPQNSLPRCAALTIRLLDGLQNEFGISGGSAWHFNSRTICQTVFSIGTSVQGRAITAYRFGSGASKIVYVGGTHGNEKSSVLIMQRWIEYLETNALKIPAHRSIIVIPLVNPDGYTANNRLNARSVDLNRNFPANNWKAGVTMPDNSYHAAGGGTAALSEPESEALANYVLGQNPRLVLTYHASGGVVVPNSSGDSRALAVTYGKQSSVGFLESSASGSFFAYDTTGAFEDWLHDKHGIPALLIELLTKTNQEFSGHQTALWQTATLP